jgi:nucleotide-binding universal stress UspA family protein
LSTEPRQVWDQTLIDYIQKLAGNFQEESITARAEFITGNPAVEVVKYCDKNQIDLIVTTSGSFDDISCSILESIATRMGVELTAPVMTIPNRNIKETNSSHKVNLLKILVPLDCSDTGESILPYVKAIAKKVNSAVILLHVNTPPLRPAPVLNNEVINISRAAGQLYVRDICERIRSWGIRAEYEVIDGAIIKTIARYANNHKVDMVAMGVPSTRGIMGWMHGNTQNKILERTSIPVMAVSRVADSIKNIPV